MSQSLKNHATKCEHPVRFEMVNKLMKYTQSDLVKDRAMGRICSPPTKECASQKVRSSHNALLVLIFCVWLQPCFSGAISGKVVACTNEGEQVHVPLVETYPCFKCYCKHGQVECVKPRCPSLKGCHAVLFSRPEGHCCDVCKGCTVKNIQMPHGATWPDDDNQCLVKTCNAGVVTITEELCRPPCKHPVRVPGQCCPSCSGCYFNGENHMSGEVFTLRDQPDVECKCMVGSVTCSSRACPVLNCPKWSRQKLPGHRCPSCKGSRTIFDTPGSCYLAQEIYGQGDTHRPDNCTSCECQQGTMVCERERCPSPECPASEQVHEPGTCCPVCPNQGACDAEGRKIQHGEVWKESNCKTCTCLNGTLQCSQPDCPPLSCPKGYVQVKKKGSCCPKCIKEYVSCSVRGESSDVIKTFGGLGYRTKGYCLHELVKDCGRREFSVKVKYERSPTGSQQRQHIQGQERSKVTTAYQLHHVSIRFGSTSVKIFRSGRLRVSKPRKVLPNTRGGKSGRSQEMGISRDTELKSGNGAAFLREMSTSIGGGKVTVRLESLGVILSWDVVRGNLKVKVKAQRYLGQRRLCGLCGSVENNWHEKSGRAQVTRGRRFEPILNSHMAWVWRRGHTCRKRSRVAREELRQQATRRKSGLDDEITSILNTVESTSHGVAYTTLGNGREQFYREDEIMIKPLGENENQKDKA